MQQQKRRGRTGGKGWDRAAVAGARFGVTTVYLVLRLPGGGSCAGMGVLQAAISKQTLGWGGMRLCFWARSSLAPVCVTASLPGLRRSSQQVGRGDKESKFPSAAGCGGRRGREEAEAADDHDPAAAGKLLGSRRRRHRLGPHPKRAPPGLVGSGETSPRDRNGISRTREESCAQARNGEPSVAGTGPEGRGGTRVSQRRA